METKPLLYGLIGFFIGGLLVSVAAQTFNKSDLQDDKPVHAITSSLHDRHSEESDKIFVTNMIAPHQSAVEVVKLSKDGAMRAELKRLLLETLSEGEKRY